jgi:hypothetical protein
MRVFHYARDRWIERITNVGFLKLTGVEAVPGIMKNPHLFLSKLLVIKIGKGLRHSACHNNKRE